MVHATAIQAAGAGFILCQCLMSKWMEKFTPAMICGLQTVIEYHEKCVQSFDWFCILFIVVLIASYFIASS